jgi:hypothetical protein
LIGQNTLSNRLVFKAIKIEFENKEKGFKRSLSRNEKKPLSIVEYHFHFVRLDSLNKPEDNCQGPTKISAHRLVNLAEFRVVHAVVEGKPVVARHSKPFQ